MDSLAISSSFFASYESIYNTAYSVDQNPVDKKETQQPLVESESKSSTGPKTESEMSNEDKQELQRLKKRDQEVRAHENAHKAAGGQYVRGGAKLEYEKGPDSRMYAVGGEVSIDTSKEADPQKSLTKAKTLRAAALAPAHPSSQDLAVAAAATAMEASARSELSRDNKEKLKSVKEELDKSQQMNQSRNGSFKDISAIAKVAAANRAYMGGAQSGPEVLATVA